VLKGKNIIGIMKIVGLGNCRNLRNYVDEIVMRNLSKGKSNFTTVQLRIISIILLSEN